MENHFNEAQLSVMDSPSNAELENDPDDLLAA